MISKRKQTLTFGEKKSASPLPYTTQALHCPLHTMDEPALNAHTPLYVDYALLFSVEVQVRVVN